MVLRQHLSGGDEAEVWMDKMVETNPKSAKAHFLRGGYLKNLGSNDEAYKEALLSLELEPDNRDGLWLASQCCLAKRDFDKAREYANHCIKLYPSNLNMYTTLADIEMNAGDRDEALAALEKGLEATARNPQLLWGLANVQIDAKLPKEAEKTIEELRQVEYYTALIDYLVARNDFVQGHWLPALNGFEKVRGTLIEWPNLLKQADVWIGHCYKHLGNRDLEQMSYRRALETDPFYTPARAGLMDVSMASGDVESALGEYEQLAKLGKLTKASLLPYARMLILYSLRQPAAQRDWKRALDVLAQAEEADPNAVQIPILRAEILVAQDRLSDAEALLEHTRRKNPEHVGLWMVLASLAERQENWERAERLLAEAGRKWGDTVSQRLAVAELLSRRHGKEGIDRIRKLGKFVDPFSDAERLQLWAGLVNIAVKVGDMEFAKELCEQIAEKQPNNIQVRFLLFEQAMRAQDDAAMESALNEIERAAGRGAYWLYGQAVRLALQAQNSKDADREPLLKQALKYLAQARESRQNWSRISLLTAGIYDQQGDTDLALENYLEAIKMGEYDPKSVQRTVQLLFAKRRYADANKLLHQLDERKAPFSSDMNRAGAEAAFRQGEYDRALEMARKTAASDSKRYQDHLWLGQMLNMLARKAKSEGHAAKSNQLMAEAAKALQHAVQIEPKLPATWVALIQFLSDAGKDDQAEKMIVEAGRNIPVREAPLAIAQCYEVMGKAEAAQQKYESALATSPEDTAVLRPVADFYCRTGKTVPAEALLRKIVDGKVQAKEADVIWARRQLAMIFTSRGGYQNRQKARELIEQNLAAQETSILDRRAKAGIDALDPARARRDEAMREREALGQGENASPADRFQLAQMYRAAGNWARANRIFRELIASSGNDPRFLSTYIKALLENNETSTADVYLDRLEEIYPNDLSTVALRAEALVATNKPEEAFALLEGFIDKPDARPPERDVRVRLVAERLEQLARRLSKPEQKAIADRFVEQAEKLYRSYLEKNPRQKILLVAFLGRNGQTDRALDLLQQTWDSNNPTVLSQVCSILLQNNVGKEQLQRLQNILEPALKQFNRSVPLLMVDADVCTRQGRFADAEACYREVIQKASGNAYAMNNLAVLLALQGVKLDEALKLIDQAVGIAGPVGAMLDSRASVYIALGEAEKAVADMLDAVADAETPVRLFHQAQAYELAGDRRAAARAMDKALQKGLTKEMLHPLEAPAFEKLKELAK